MCGEDGGESECLLDRATKWALEYHPIQEELKIGSDDGLFDTVTVAFLF